MDDLGIWNRALSYEEILSLTNSEQLVFGCTNDDACNLNPEANVDFFYIFTSLVLWYRVRFDTAVLKNTNTAY